MDASVVVDILQQMHHEMTHRQSWLINYIMYINVKYKTKDVK